MISNYKTPNQSHLVNRGETPVFKNKAESKLTAKDALDTRTLLSDHIKKHIKAARNGSNNNGIQSPKTEKLASKSCNKTS